MGIKSVKYRLNSLPLVKLGRQKVAVVSFDASSTSVVRVAAESARSPRRTLKRKTRTQTQCPPSSRPPCPPRLPPRYVFFARLNVTRVSVASRATFDGNLVSRGLLIVFRFRTDFLCVREDRNLRFARGGPGGRWGRARVGDARDGWNEFRFIRFIRARVVARDADGVVGVVPSERSRTPSKNSKTFGSFLTSYDSTNVYTLHATQNQRGEPRLTTTRSCIPLYRFNSARARPRLSPLARSLSPPFASTCALPRYVVDALIVIITRLIRVALF
jgi:hypothetical protein